MSQGTVLHVCNWDKKFIPPFIDFIHEHFGHGRHQFIVYGDVESDVFAASSDTSVHAKLLRNVVSLSIAMSKAEKVIIHGLFSNHLLYILALQPWLLKKCCWVIWGGDLYVHVSKRSDWRFKKDEFLRKLVIKRIPLITTTVPGDYYLAQSWYGSKASFCQNLMYRSHVARHTDTGSDSDNELLTIQIGNSADPSNNHREIIDRLVALPRRDFVVYAPLSYGNDAYRDEIIAYGNKKLGSRFKPLTKLMSFKDYDDYLKKIDIAVFNHARQQAMGNTIALLSLGKTVWLRSDVTPWDYFNSLGVKLYDFTAKFHLEKIQLEQRLSNIELCKRVFSEEKLIFAWEMIFDNSWQK